MKTVHFGLRSWTAAMAVAALLVGCGGGAGDDVAGPLAASGTQLHTLALAIAPPPPDCTVATLSVANIDFGQVGWTGDDSTGNPMAITTLVPASVSFTDNVTYTHTVQWVWGDGTSATGTVTEAAGAGVATQTHTYAAAGVYTVSAIVTNNVCPSSKTVTRQLVVYDPTGGFVTGGGWINSPAGAFKADPSLTGRANFGFVAKYLKGANVPIGQTEFQFQTAKLNFHSDSYEWLVVAGARAEYKGAGSVNGNGGFKFFLTAIDGGLLADGKNADRFRIKIWHTDANNSDVIDYDNQIDPTLEAGTIEGTTLGGGSIVIHK